MTYYFLPQPSTMAIGQHQIAPKNGNKIKQLRG